MPKRPRADGKHRPFERLQELIDRGEMERPEPTDKLIAPPKRVSAEATDEEAFQDAMKEVRPLGWSATPLKLPLPVELPSRDSSSEAEALERLADFVAGRGEIDAFDVGEGIEGASSRDGHGYLPRLRRGDFSVQAHLDLHGLGPEEAKPAMLQFLKDAQRRRLSCVRIVHGRGRHSGEEPSVLKNGVRRFLSSRRMRRIVVAFASARWRDGGGGALYVLLYGKWKPARMPTQGSSK